MPRRRSRGWAGSIRATTLPYRRASQSRNGVSSLTLVGPSDASGWSAATERVLNRGGRSVVSRRVAPAITLGTTHEHGRPALFFPSPAGRVGPSEAPLVAALARALAGAGAAPRRFVGSRTGGRHR